jgi:hypothetical protein
MRRCPMSREMLHQPPRAGGAICLDEIAFDIRKGAIDKHERQSAARQRQEVEARVVVDGRYDQPFDAMRHHVFDVAALQP